MTLECQLQGLSVAAPSSVSSGVALGTGLSDGFSVFESPLGSVVVAFNPLGVSAVDLLTDGFEDRFAERFRRQLLEARPPSDWEELIVRALAQGTPGALPVDFRSVTAFQRQVLEHTAAIPRGETRSYGWLAGQAGRPGAARAVGQTMARNPVPLVIPCHRVVLSGGGIGHYALGGTEHKRLLLKSEGANF